jgi:hypothetical protein
MSDNMINQRALICVFTIIIAVLLVSCSSDAIMQKVYPTLNDGLYDSEFPYRNSSVQLEEISNSIKLINSIAFYTSYIFDETSNIRARELPNINLDKVAKENVYFNRTASGTGTVVYNKQGHVALLTVSHIVSFPDTVISFFINPDGSFTQYVQSISIKSKQTNYVNDLPGNGELDIIAMDKPHDIALLGKTYNVDSTTEIPVFPYTWGASSELEWGSFIYAFGFPMNFKMITKGIVSSPSKDKHSFLIDAAFNRGFSGGIVLAVRDGVPNFELVGIIRSVPADYSFTLRPMTKEQDLDFNPMIPYTGEAFVDKEQVIKPGITKVIGIELVKEFIQQQKEVLNSQGYFFEELVKEQKPLQLKITH